MTKQLTEMSLAELWELFPIYLVEHREDWKSDFNEIEKQLRSLLNDQSAIRISHIGSTAVDTIMAKDIVDVLVEMPQSSNLKSAAKTLEQNGFIIMSESENRISLNIGYTPNGFADKVYHIHIRYFGDNDELYFRDYLIDHPDIAKEYEGLKLKLWKRFEHDRDAYTAAKTDFIRLHTTAAHKEYFNKYDNYQKMTTENYTIRLEQQCDQCDVENLIRDSFWNVYRPGCVEHYVIHVLRDDPAFVKELDFVMEQNDKIVGQNMFMKAIIIDNYSNEIPVLTMGPICISNELKGKGYGKKLLTYSLDKAAEMGFGAVLIEGDLSFYGKCGFDFAAKFGIRYHDLPEDADSSFFLCKELIPGYLDTVTGVYQTPKGYYIDENAAEEFDKSFPPQQKLNLPGQLI